MFAFSADPLAEATSLVAKLSLETPKDFMRHLRACESDSVCEQVVSRYGGHYDHDRFRALVPEYLDYFSALALSKLSDKQKLQASLVMVPFFKDLKNGSQESKDKVAQEVGGRINDLNYPIGRLLLAALCYAGANMNDKGFSFRPASRALLVSDYSLLEKLLCAGVDPNCNRMCTGDPLLSGVRTVQMADLLLKYGADIYQQHQKRDLIRYMCSYTGNDADPCLIALYLKYIPLDEANGFGKKWFDRLIMFSSYLSRDLPVRVKLLLDCGCHYDQKKIKNIINKENLDDEKKETIKKLFHDAFDLDKKKRQNVVMGLRDRQIAGRRMHRAKVNMNAVHERVMQPYEEERRRIKEQMENECWVGDPFFFINRFSFL